MPIVVLINAYRSGQIRREVRQGREYVVVPATIIVPGVLNGSNGALYYPASEVEKNKGVWNGTPIHVGHPMDPLTNLPVSGRDPETMDRSGIGYVYNDRVNRKSHRQCDLYLDVQLTRNYDRDHGSDILYRATHGQAIELSTGLFTDNYPAMNGARDDKGRPYDFVARNYRPDHLAILPFERGACSVQDGCGVNIANRTVQNHREKPMNPFQKLISSLKGVIRNAETNKNGERVPNPTVSTAAKRGFDHTSGHEQAPKGDADDDGSRDTFDPAKRTQGDRGRPADGDHTNFGAADQDSTGAGKQTMGNALRFCPDCGKKMSAENCSCGYKVSPSTRNMGYSGMTGGAVASGTGAAGSPIGVGIRGMGPGSTATANDDDGTDEDGVQDDGNDGTSMDENCYGMSKNDSDDADDPDDDRDNDSSPEGSDTSRNVAHNSAGETGMLTTNQRRGIVSDLCTNCDCWQGQEKVLNAMPDENLVRLKEIAIQERNNKLLAESVRNGLRIRGADGKVITVNAKTQAGKLVVNAFKGVSNAFGSDVVNPVPAKAKGGDKGHAFDAPAQSDGDGVQVGGEEDSPEGDIHASVQGDEVKARNLPPGMTGNAEAVLRRDKWFQNAPKHIQQMLLNQLRKDEQHRRSLAEMLVPPTVNGRAREEMIQDYLLLPTVNLERHVRVVGVVGNRRGVEADPLYGFAAVLPGERTDNAADDQDVLDLPKMAW